MRSWAPIFIPLALGAAVGGWAAPPGNEPFWTRNENPVSRLFGLPPGGDAAAGGDAGWQARMAVDVANTSFERIRGADELVLDFETEAVGLELRRVWEGGWRAGVQVPVVSHQGGNTDDFIKEYHGWMGFAQGNRAWRPAGRLEGRHRRGGDTLFNLDGATTGVGDVRLFGAAPLAGGPAAPRALDAVAGVELPTGDPDRLLGSGSADFSLGLAARDSASLARWNLEVHGGVGVLAMTEGEILGDRQNPFAGYGSFSLGWRLARWLVPRLQVDGHSPFFADTSFTPLDDWAAVLVTGATVFLPADVALDIAVAEDVAVNTAPDVVFHFSLKRRW